MAQLIPPGRRPRLAARRADAAADAERCSIPSSHTARTRDARSRSGDTSRFRGLRIDGARFRRPWTSPSRTNRRTSSPRFATSARASAAPRAARAADQRLDRSPLGRDLLEDGGARLARGDHRRRRRRLETRIAALRDRVQSLYHAGIDRPKLTQWLAAHDLVATYVAPAEGSVWRADRRELPQVDEPKELCDVSATTSSRSASSTSSCSASSSRFSRPDPPAQPDADPLPSRR
jgi:hypothetical protein